MVCIIVFAFIYYFSNNHFQLNNGDNIKYNSFIDFLLLSTTIQSGVGISDLYPISFLGKIVVIFQQIILLLTHIVTLYVFTL